MTIKSDIQKLNDKICTMFGNQCLNYGEGHEVILENEGANYASVSDNQPCSVNDNYDLVMFYVRTGSEPTGQLKGGNQTVLSRNVSFKLIGNAKGPDAEFNLAVLVNSIAGIKYTGSDNNAKSVAQTYFFSIDFTNVETIVCPKC